MTWEGEDKNIQFNATVGSTTGCTFRSLLNSITQEEQELKHFFQGDAWFGSVHTANKWTWEGFQVKQYASLFPKEFFEDALKAAPRGVQIVLERTTTDEVKLVSAAAAINEEVAPDLWII
jgi:hypothetical protein